MASSNLTRLKEDLKALLDRGLELVLSMAIQLGLDKGDEAKKIKKLVKGKKLPSFRGEYEKWYSESVAVIEQVLPARLADFTRLYREEKRKEIDYLTYMLSDYMLGLETSRHGKVIADGKAAFPKFQQQVFILESVWQRFESTLFDIRGVVQADIFDDELSSARELLGNGYVRAAGTIAGVILESHLSEVCTTHKIRLRKKNPAINDYNQALKDKEVIELPTWRFVQHLADIRNMCTHKKKREPKPGEVDDLIDGVEKTIKSVH